MISADEAGSCATRFFVDLDPAGEGYTVTVPVLPGCIAEGNTIDEAIVNAREAIACHLEGLLLTGDEIPCGTASADSAGR